VAGAVVAALDKSDVTGVLNIVDDHPAPVREWLPKKAPAALARGSPPHRPTTPKLLTRFLAAAQDGDMTALTELLAYDMVAYNDGGGKVRAALLPIIGRGNVLAFVAGLMSRYPLQEAHLTQANGEPAIYRRAAAAAKKYQSWGPERIRAELRRRRHEVSLGAVKIVIATMKPANWTQ
jgi:hypothetical protein